MRRTPTRWRPGVRLAALGFLLAATGSGLAGQPAGRTLTVCADPNNLPFSNAAGEGFENQLAALLADSLHARLEYVWWSQRRGYIRNTLQESRCDLWPGVASSLESVLTSRPYYRSTYMFVSRRDRDLGGLNLDDPRLQHLRIGVQLVGDDGMNTPPAHALARRGITGNVVGFMLYGDNRQPNPPAAIVRAVADRKIDVALVWGPLAGYFAGRSRVAMRLEPVEPWLDDAQWPMVYDISVGIRKDNQPLLREVQRVLAANAARIEDLLAAYGVPNLIPTPLAGTNP